MSIMRDRQPFRTASLTQAPPGVLQRKCACGTHTTVAGKCHACSNAQAKLTHTAINSIEAEDIALRGNSNSVTEVQHDFTGVPAYAQAKLRLSRSDDPHEFEADRVAESVVDSGQIKNHAITSVSPMLNRQEETEESTANETEAQDDLSEAEGDEEETEDDIVADETGMPKRMDGGSAVATSVAMPGGLGRPLESGVRDFMEQRIGHDFSQVRIHADATAADSAQRLGAHAYTVGTDIYFGRGRFNTFEREGQKLLAHELTHVVQQTGIGRGDFKPTGVQRKPRRRRTSRAATCTGSCVGSSAPRHDGCSSGSAAAGSRFITDLTVHRAAHQVVATWNSGPPDTWAVSPSTRSGRGGKIPTPLGSDVVGIKCDQCHTNRHGDGMAWFTGFARHGRAVGFHNSQLVGPSHESHGCVRSPCSVAKTIHDNTSTGVTTINVLR